MTPMDVQKLIANPFYAIEMHPMVGTPHEPLIPVDQWIDSNLKLMTELGRRKWLKLLLDCLREPMTDDEALPEPTA